MPEKLRVMMEEPPSECVPLAREACRHLLLRDTVRGGKRFFCTVCNKTFEIKQMQTVSDETAAELYYAKHNDEADRALFGAREEQKKADEAAMEELRDKLRSAEESRDSAVKSAQKNEKAHGKAASAWAAEKKELERQLEEAREAASQVSIDSEIDEDKRAEIEAAVAATYEDKLAELRRESERKLTAAGNPAVIEVNILFGDLQETYARIAALIEGIRAESPEMGDKLAAALRAALTTMIGG